MTKILVVGAGLLGTSIGLGLTKLGHQVQLIDNSASAVALASDYGAGAVFEAGFEPELVFVCVPPEQTAKTISQQLLRFPDATVTDVASVKGSIARELADSIESERYVPGHPMAGRERGGAIAGRADLFVARPWVLCSTEKTDPVRFEVVRKTVAELGATPISMSPEDHDRAVALVSHVPQAVSSLLAARLAHSEPTDIALAGAGLRDTTRIAASDPELWLQIFAANAGPVNRLLKELKADLNKLIDALDHVGETGSLAQINSVLDSGNRGVALIPGKHGSKAQQYSRIVVMIDDRPGELGRLFNEVGTIGINIEELQLEHSPSAEIGLVELFVVPSEAERLTSELLARGWRIAG